MPGTSTHAGTHGFGLRSSATIRSAIHAIVQEVSARASAIRDIRPPDPGLREEYEALMARASACRGRGLLYPSLGSGLGNGALVELADGSVKWDMICGIGVQFFGHSDPELLGAALEGSLSDTLMQGNLQSNFEAYELAEVLLREASRGSRVKHCFVSPTGALANENALKVCHQKHAGAPRVLAFKDCFMGRTVTLSQIGDAAGNRVGLPLSTLVDYMPFYDEGARGGAARQIDMAVQHLRGYIERYPRQHACFIFELVQGEGGFNTAPREYFRELMGLCRASGIAVWDDEIQTFGRTGSMFAYEALEVGDLVDVVTVGKMTQACATLFTPEYNPGPGLLSATFTGATPQFRVGRRIVERLRDGDFYGPGGSIARHHTAFVEQVRALAGRRPELFPAVKGGALSPAPADIVGGAGGMMRFSPFGGDKDKVIKACHACFDEGVVLFYCGHGPYHIRRLPPLGVMRLEDWPRVFGCVERGLSRVAGG